MLFMLKHLTTYETATLNHVSTKPTSTLNEIASGERKLVQARQDGPGPEEEEGEDCGGGVDGERGGGGGRHIRRLRWWSTSIHLYPGK